MDGNKSILDRMMNKPKAIFSWSGGKDSAYCLHKVLSENLFDVVYLLTTVNDRFHRVSMHGVRESLLEKQAESIGIPLLKVIVSEGTNQEYERQMEAILIQAKSEDIQHVIFGDIFLEDLRVYREKNLAKVGMEGVFPLWKIDTALLIRDFVTMQFKTVLSCTNDAYLGEEWVGREIDTKFIAQLPMNVDPCGENGEFHSFCYDGPLFKKKIDFSFGEKIYKPLDIKLQDKDSSSTEIRTKGFWYCDLVPLI